MNNRPRRLWLSEDDIYAVDMRHKAVFFRADTEPHEHPGSSLDLPVTRVNKTTFKLDRSRLSGEAVSLYCPILTIYNPGVTP